MRYTVEYIKGRMSQVNIHSHDMNEVECKNTSAGPMITLRDDSRDTATIFLPPDLARDLHSKLHAILFPGPE